MVTRGSITIIFNKKKFFIYNGYDSFPHYLGIKLLNELKNLLKKYSIKQLIYELKKIKILRTSEDFLSKPLEKVEDDETIIKKILKNGYVIQDETTGEFNYFIDLNKEIIYLEKEDSNWKSSLNSESLSNLIRRTKLELVAGTETMIIFLNNKEIYKCGKIKDVFEDYFTYIKINDCKIYRMNFINVKQIWKAKELK